MSSLPVYEYSVNDKSDGGGGGGDAVAVDDGNAMLMEVDHLSLRPSGFFSFLH